MAPWLGRRDATFAAMWGWCSRESYNEMGLTQYNRKRYFASELTPVLEAVLPPGTYRLLVSVQVEVTHHKYWDGYVDALNPEAIARFIDHDERYAERYGGDFGGAIHSIFVDEIAPTWSDRLPAAFEAACGYDLIAALPALQDVDPLITPGSPMTLGGCVAQPSARLSSGPLPRGAVPRPRLLGRETGATAIATALDGYPRLRTGSHQGRREARLAAGPDPEQCQSHRVGSLLLREGRALCECYHSTGWSATLQDAKLIADGCSWQASATWSRTASSTTMR